MANGLTDKQERFCYEYLVDLNATQAAIRAGYSEKTARDIACENLAKPNLQAKIAELKDEALKAAGISSEQAIRELKNIVLSDITETMLLTAQELKELPGELRRLIQSFKRTVRRFGDDNEIEEEMIEVKFYDKLRATEILAKYASLFNNKSNNDIKDTPQTIEVVIKRNED